MAITLSCVLRDSFDDYNNSPYKASVRPIPGGISVKRYDGPCFVMQEAATKEEVDDVPILISEIKKFMKQWDLSKINILLVDDNLTGSSRMALFFEMLAGETYINIDTLAYVRHPIFYTPLLKYMITKYPTGSQYFVMPYHNVKNKVPVNNINVTTQITLAIDIKEKVNVTELQRRLEATKKYAKVDVEEYSDGKEKNVEVGVRRGESIISLLIGANTIQFRYHPHKWYAPKECLNGKPKIFQEQSLCKHSGQTLDGNQCTLCSYMNCNSDIIDILLDLEQGPRRIHVLHREGLHNEALIALSKKWLAIKFGEKVLDA